MKLLDSRWYNVILIVVIVIPLINPLGLPIPVSKGTNDLYDAIEALQPGDNVLIASPIHGGSLPELGPQLIAVTQHLFRRPGVNIFFFGLIVDAPGIIETIVLPKINKEDKIYGVDYVNLGFIPGDEAALSGIAGGILNVLSVDYRGNTLSEMEIMKNVKDANDLSLAIGFFGSEDVVWMIRQLFSPYDVPVGAGLTGLTYTTTSAFITSKQIFAALNGIKGAAEYEVKIRSPGSAAMNLDAQSLAHIVLIVIIIMGNIYDLMRGEK